MLTTSDLLRHGKPRRRADEEPWRREALDDLEALLEDLRELNDLERQYANPPVRRLADREAENRWGRLLRERIAAIRGTWGIR